MKETSSPLSASASHAAPQLLSGSSSQVASPATSSSGDPEVDTEYGVESALSQQPTTHTHIRPGTGWFDWKLREMWRFRELLLALATRDVKLRYRQTVLGVIWVVVQPLLGAGVLSFIFNRVAGLSSGETPYFIFVFCGFLGWNAFSSLVSRASNSVLAHSGLVTKIYFPRLLLPLSTTFSVLLDFSISFVVLLVLLVVYGITPSAGIWLLPVWLFLLMLLALGIASMAGALIVRYRDVGHILPVMLNLLLYASAVAFPLEEAYRRVPERFHLVFELNPITGLIEAIRWSVLGTGSLRQEVLWYSVAGCIAMFLLGVTIFRRLERQFPDII